MAEDVGKAESGGKKDDDERVADEEKIEDGDKAPSEGKKKGKGMKLAIIGVLAILLLGGGGYFLVGAGYLSLGFLSSKEDGAVKDASAKAKAADEPAPVYPMRSFIVNLAGSKGRRYLKVTLSLALSEDAVKKEIKKRLPWMRDQILTILSSKTFEDIQDSVGKRRLRREIVARVNRILKTGKAQRVFLTEFVIQ